jgi:hypothetical protein
MKTARYIKLVALVILANSLNVLAMGDKYMIAHLLGPFRSPESTIRDETIQKLLEKQKKVEQKIYNRARVIKFIQDCGSELEKIIKKSEEERKRKHQDCPSSSTEPREVFSSISNVEWLTPLNEEHDILKEIKLFLGKPNRRTNTIALAYLFDDFNESLTNSGIIHQVLREHFPHATIQYEYGCGTSFCNVGEKYKDKHYSVTLITFNN